MATNGRITMAILATKLDLQTETIRQLVGEFKLHVDKDREIEIGLDRLREAEKNRAWHIRALWTAVLTGIVAGLVKLIS